ncbi:hypothetical protein Clacol_001529 [Clathrus columnatus]|uniref:1-acyl-sn-glycerol-3-phosphate acyltransferase n=1 Tax=Clathrus columnatus TaxID=1419009 RepID=A0AAV5A283_9AGAM|nr:hypothetical protein Clacol_001529 [Clathrus columnatus]
MMGITCEVEGEHWFEVTGPAVMVGNHQSMLDILYLGRIFPERAAMVAKKELKWIPLFGQYLAFSGTVFLDRSSNSNAVKSLAEAGETIKSRKISVWLFPEGTRSLKPENTLLPFKKGAFHLAVEAGVPIIPVTWLIKHREAEGYLIINGMIVLEPIPTKDLTPADVSSLALRTHQIMEAALQELSCDETRPPSLSEEKLAPMIPTEDDDQKTFLDETTQSVDSTSPERWNSEGSIVETESDEGMVVISKPTRTQARLNIAA